MEQLQYPNTICLEHAMILARIEQHTKDMAKILDHLMMEMPHRYASRSRFVILERAVYGTIAVIGAYVLTALVQTVVALT